MSWLKKVLNYSVGKKLIMALTGLFLSIFLVEHLIANLLLLKDDAGVAFNTYAEEMVSNPLIRITEFVLLFGFLFHIVDGFMLTAQNNKARLVKYVKYNASNSSWFSRNMIYTGILLLVFLLLHLFHFLISHRLMDSGVTFYDASREVFGKVYFTGFYVLAFIALALHLNHGFQSAFQSLGLNHKKYTPVIKAIGTVFAFGVNLGFALIALLIYIETLS